MRRAVIVESPLSFRMRRIAGARRCEVGLQIVTLPFLAARLVGGFTRPARSQHLDLAIRAALEGGGFAEIEGIRELPSKRTTRGSCSRRAARARKSACWGTDAARPSRSRAGTHRSCGGCAGICGARQSRRGGTGLASAH
jgi:hypothetical protein